MEMEVVKIEKGVRGGRELGSLKRVLSIAVLTGPTSPISSASPSPSLPLPASSIASLSESIAPLASSQCRRG